MNVCKWMNGKINNKRGGLWYPFSNITPNEHWRLVSTQPHSTFYQGWSVCPTDYFYCCRTEGVPLLRAVYQSLQPPSWITWTDRSHVMSSTWEGMKAFCRNTREWTGKQIFQPHFSDWSPSRFLDCHLMRNNELEPPRNPLVDSKSSETMWDYYVSGFML